jgi:hypothetical protein
MAGLSSLALAAAPKAEMTPAKVAVGKERSESVEDRLFGGRGWCRQGEGALPSDIYCGPPTAEGLENASPPALDGLQRERGNGVSIGSGFRAGRVLVALASAALGLVLSGSGAWAEACEAKPVQALLGKPYTETLRRNAQAASHASLVQALRRGEATTAEFRGDRPGHHHRS